MMVKRHILAILIFMFCISAFAESAITLYGKVTDKQGAGLPYAKVEAVCCDTLITAITDGSGAYSIELPPSDSIVVCITYEGFKPQRFEIAEPRKSIEKNVTLEEDAIALQEVVVRGNQVIYGKEKSMYFPTKTQKKSTNNGFGLLYNMMIPEIRVSRKSGDITTSDNKRVTPCINGVPASLAEIRAVRAKDIIRIDFYPVTSGKYARYEAVIDYVVRNYNHGGYIDVKTATTVLNTSGDYDLTIKYNREKWNYSIMGGFDFSNNRKHKNITDEWVGLSHPFEKQSMTEKYKKSSYNHYLHWGGTRTGSNIYLSLKAGILGNNTPHSDVQNTTTYSPEVFPTSVAFIRKDSKSMGAYLNEYMQLTINKFQYLTLEASYQTGRNDYYRQMKENIFVSTISTKEDCHEYYLGLTYSQNMNKVGNLTFQIYEIGESFKDWYDSDQNNKQSLVNNYIKTSLIYKHHFSDNLYVQTDLSLQHVASKVNKTKENTWLFLPMLYMSFKTGERGRLIFNGKTGYVTPPIQWKSNIYQDVNAYEQIKGNKDLYHFPAYMPSLSYSYSTKTVAMNLTASTFLAKHSVQDTYLIENDKLIHTYSIGDSFHGFMFDYKLTSYLMDNNLQLSAGIGYDITKTNDEQKKRWGGFRYTIDAMYNYKDFVFSGSYMSKIKGMEFTGSSYSEYPYNYNLSAAYTKSHWYASMDFNNIFGSRHHGKEYIYSSAYRNTTTIKSRDYYPSITFTLSYTFDFGHKKIEHEEEEFDRTISTGYLRPKE